MKKISKFILCEFLGWHKCSTFVNDGVNSKGKCDRCGEECLQDSQGNWFSVKEPSTWSNIVCGICFLILVLIIVFIICKEVS